MIQFSRFSDGCYVLHKVMIGTQKYSAWFGADGVLFSAERFYGDRKDLTRDVPLHKHTEVAKQLQKIGLRYVAVDTATS